MKLDRTVAAISTGLVMAALAAAPALAANVIPGPLLDQPGGGWSYTGIEFHANQASVLTGFTFQNQGQADTVVLTDFSGNIFDSLNTPALTTSYTASVSWSLVAGQDYRLLQTTTGNELFAAYDGALPSNADISITKSGTFDDVLDQSDTGSSWYSNQYWAAFNDITTTSVAAVPEPETYALMLGGFGLLGFVARRRGKIAA